MAGFGTLWARVCSLVLVVGCTPADLTYEIPCPGCVCEAGASVPCYDGPEKTRGVGVCKDGTSTCEPNGTAAGECTGQVLPADEDDCATPEDEDCDGKTPACAGSPVWQQTTPGPYLDAVTGMDVSEPVYVASTSDTRRTRR